VSVVDPGARPEHLVAGNPDGIEALATRFEELAGSSAAAVDRLRGLDTEHWSGEAGDAFRAVAAPVPEHLRRARDAFRSAATTLRSYASTLRDSQASAGHAIRISADAEAATTAWRNAGGTGDDPGQPDRDRAYRILAGARDDVLTAGHAAALRLGAIATDAPGPTADVGSSGGLPSVRSSGVTARAVVDRPVRDGVHFVDSAGGATTAVDYRSPHDVGFAGSAPASWERWGASGGSHLLGQVGTEALLALGIGIGAAAATRRRRRTAISRAGVDPRSVPAPARAGSSGVVAGTRTRLRTPGAWRTQLRRPPAQDATLGAPLPGAPAVAGAAVAVPAAAVRHVGPPAV